MTSSHTYLDSTAFPGAGNIEYVNGSSTPSGSCTTCHGDDSGGTYWPDSTPSDIRTPGTSGPAERAGAHGEHVLAINAVISGPANGSATCGYCHPTGAHTGDQASDPADVANADTTGNGTPDTNTGYRFKYIVDGSDDPNGWIRQNEADTRCSNVKCHAGAPYTPGWYGDTVIPGVVTNFNSASNPEPGTVLLGWQAPGDDNGDDGTAFQYEVRYSTSAISTRY